MKHRLTHLFIFSAGVILIATALAKIISATDDSRILTQQDPIFSIPFRWVFFGVGGVELIVAIICFIARSTILRAVLIAWLTISFTTYRIALHYIGYEKPCSCLGSFTERLYISPQTADSVMKWILAYLFVGSALAVGAAWKKQATVKTISNEEIPSLEMARR